MTVGSASSTAIPGQPCQPSGIIPPLRPPSGPSLISPAITVQPSPPLLTSAPSMSLIDNQDPNQIGNRVSNLVKPSTFFGPPPSQIPPVTSSIPTVPPLLPPANLQRPYGAPLLQPFPPPTPPPSLTPSSIPSTNYGHVITREKVRDALLMLAQVCVFEFTATTS